MTPCQVWPLSVGSHGYGQKGTRVGGKVRVTTAHRWAWEQANGPIPEGMTVDHVCRNRLCVNVEHLRLMTNVENARDNGYSRRTHCPAGHPYDEANTYVTPKGHRRCRLCKRVQRTL